MAGLTRRSALAASGAALACASAGRAWSQPFASPGRERFSSVVADVSVLRSGDIGLTTDLLQQVLTAELRKEFAGRLGGPGPRLLVRITGVSLNAYAGSGTGRWGLGSGTNNDYLEGEALVVGRRGEILARYPQLSAVPASSGGRLVPAGFRATPGRRARPALCRLAHANRALILAVASGNGTGRKP